MDNEVANTSGAGTYVKVQEKLYAPRSERETAEGKFWRSFRSVVDAQQIGAVTSLDFSPTAPHNFAVTSSTRVIIYDAATRKAKRTISRFADIAYSGSFRSDGQLLVAGGETGIVQVFDAGSRAILRQLKGHSRAVHVARYGDDKVHVLSAGDDQSVRYWDVPTGEEVHRVGEHDDYVRCAALCPASPHLWATGSYDHTVRLWDMRVGVGGETAKRRKSVMTLQHSTPLEDVAFFPAGALLATAGGNHVSVWDLVAGGRLMQRVAPHQKTITCLQLAPMAAASPADRTPGPRLLTGSLDCHVKIHDLDSFQVVHAARYAAPILALGLSPAATTLAVGMSTGLLSIRQRSTTKSSAAAAGPVRTLLPGMGGRKRRQQRRRGAAALASAGATSFRYFLRGRNERAAEEDYVVAGRRAAHMTGHDKMLRRFRYADALSAALRSQRPPVVMGVMEELVARGALRAALANRDAPALLPLLAFVAKYVSNPRYSGLLVQVARALLPLYATSFGLTPAVDHQLELLRERVVVEVRLAQALVALQGLMLPLMHSSAAAAALHSSGD